MFSFSFFDQCALLTPLLPLHRTLRGTKKSGGMLDKLPGLSKLIVNQIGGAVVI